MHWDVVNVYESIELSRIDQQFLFGLVNSARECHVELPYQCWPLLALSCFGAWILGSRSPFAVYLQETITSRAQTQQRTIRGPQKESS